jgi:hypothetical protein
LAERLKPRIVSTLRLSTHRGRPLVSDRFLSKIESLLGRRLRPLPVGRPSISAGPTGTCRGRRAALAGSGQPPLRRHGADGGVHGSESGAGR